MDIDHLRAWIGRTETASERLSPQIVQRFEATFDRVAAPADGDPAPLLVHYCIAPAALPASALGRDGHPARGGFLPPVPLPRRMWAGGGFTFHDAPRVGDMLTRTSTVADVVAKQGRTGPLCFVTVSHRIAHGDRPLLTERQDIVFREDPDPAAPVPAADPAPEGQEVRRLVPTPTLLFRYSALTFNGHRIHYDPDYCRDVEGYPGLVVHGPMLATLLCRFAADLLGRPLLRFEFRSVSTLFDTADVLLNASPEAEGLRLWACHPGGPVAMQATAS